MANAPATIINNENKAKLRISPNFHRICLSLRLLPLSKVITFDITVSLRSRSLGSRRDWLPKAVWEVTDLLLVRSGIPPLQ